MLVGDNPDQYDDVTKDIQGARAMKPQVPLHRTDHQHLERLRQHGVWVWGLGFGLWDLEVWG